MLHRKGGPAIVQSVHAIVSKHKGGKPDNDYQVVDGEVPEQECFELGSTSTDKGGSEFSAHFFKR